MAKSVFFFVCQTSLSLKTHSHSGARLSPSCGAGVKLVLQVTSKPGVKTNTQALESLHLLFLLQILQIIIVMGNTSSC